MAKRYRIEFEDGHTQEVEAADATVAKRTVKQQRSTELNPEERRDPRVKVKTVTEVSNENR